MSIVVMALFGVCIYITVKQCIKPVPHTKDPHGRGKHVDFYC